MTREEFLQKIWLSYPVCNEKSATEVLGRISRVEPDVVLYDGKSHHILGSRADGTEAHSVWGPAIPKNCLRVGDCVGLCLNQGSIHLLSPRLIEAPELETEMRWIEFLDHVENFFKGRGYQKLRTPNLVTSPGVDHQIDFFSVRGVQSGRVWSLPTSPEMSLKKKLAQGYDRVFEIKSCFRDDLPGPLHRAEFTMLEWYHSFASPEVLIEDLEALFSEVLKEVAPFERLSVAEAFEIHLNFKLSPKTTSQDLRTLAESLELHTHPTDDWNDLFFRLFMEKIETQLGINGPLILEKYPTQQASLSKIRKDGWCDRFELYWQGVELANAYREENDPELNRKVFSQQEALRKRRNSALAPHDESYFEALRWGLPPCSGIALGLDRLFHLGCLNKTHLIST